MDRHLRRRRGRPVEHVPVSSSPGPGASLPRALGFGQGNDRQVAWPLYVVARTDDGVRNPRRSQAWRTMVPCDWEEGAE